MIDVHGSRQMNVLSSSGESQDDVRDRAMFCELLYRSVPFSCIFTNCLLYKLKEGRRKQLERTDFIIFCTQHNWINAKSQEADVNTHSLLDSCINKVTGINAMHQNIIKYLFM